MRRFQCVHFPRVIFLRKEPDFIIILYINFSSVAPFWQTHDFSPISEQFYQLYSYLNLLSEQTFLIILLDLQLDQCYIFFVRSISVASYLATMLSRESLIKLFILWTQIFLIFLFAGFSKLSPFGNFDMIQLEVTRGLLCKYNALLKLSNKKPTLSPIYLSLIILPSIVCKLKSLMNKNFHQFMRRMRYDLEIYTYKQKQLQYTYNRQMIKLNCQLGSNPLRYHNPVQYKSSDNFLITVGENGEIVGWQLPQVEPIYQIICSALADTDGLIDFMIAPIKLITNQVRQSKIVTLHNDDRIRIFTINDGLCRTVSHHGLLPQKILGLVENQVQSRFLLCFGEKNLYIIDSWSMKVVDSLQPNMDSFSILKRGRINKKMELQLMDKQSKIYRINFYYLFEETHLDIGNWLSNSAKSGKALLSSIQKIKAEPVITSYRKIQDQDLTEVIQKVNEKLKERHSQNIWLDILEEKYKNFQAVNYLLSLTDEQPVISNCFFLKSTKLWYFFGTNKGRILGIPAVLKENEQIIIANPLNQINSTVSYLSVFQNLLIASWENGTFNIYTIDNLQYTIQTSLSNLKMEKQQNQNKLCLVDLNLNKVVNEKLSSEIKYRLEIYSTSKGKLGTNLLSFQLNNNEVIVFQTISRKLTHYRGVPEGTRIYVVLEIEDYIGIAHSKGIDVYSADRYEKTIQYDKWIWSDYQLCQNFKIKDDYHNIYSKIPGYTSQTDIGSVNAMMMFEFNERFYQKKLDYCSPSIDLLYETFGPLESQEITNELYPQIHFIQRVYSQRTIHSHSNQSATSVIRVKHSNVRRQKLTNTTYLYSCNLNKQLQIFTNDKEIPTQQFEKNLSLFSLFLWDQDELPYLSEMYANSKSKFIMKRRYTEQGIGRSFTIYFNNKFKNQLSSELITYSSIATVALLQVCSAKDIELTDQMVNAVQYYTVRRNEHAIQVDVQTLSRISVTVSHPILKACVNILMSTALTQIVPLHPANDYFLINLKNIQEKNNIILTETQTIWFVYLGIGFIYSNQQCDRDQVKKLIQRLIKTIDVKNFQTKPDLIQIVLKVLNEGVKKWKTMISQNIVMKIFADLFRIFFYYDGLSSVQPDDKKFNFCFETVSVADNKRMKQQIIKTIIYLSKQFNNQFLQVIRIQAVNQKPHSSYPASVIQILRQYIKAEKPNTNLVFYIQLLLQCLSPMTPQLRKHVQKNVLSTLQLMRSSYENISFNQPSQKLSLRTDSNIYIYCLRTSTKWRTISLKEEKQTENSILQMSPKGTYIALLGDKLRIWRLSSGFWSGVLGAFSQGWTFEAKGHDVCWDEKEEYITVINENPSENKCFKL